jgi:hypothetical protein
MWPDFGLAEDGTEIVCGHVAEKDEKADAETNQLARLFATRRGGRIQTLKQVIAEGEEDFRNHWQ